MAETATFRQADSAGLVVAIALHACVVVLLLMQPAREAVMEIPERMTVSLATEVSLESTAPDPVPESRAAIAPTLGDNPAPTAQSAPPQVQPDQPPIQPRTQPTIQPRVQPRPQQRTASAPTPRATTPPSATRRTPSAQPARDRTRPDRTQPAKTANPGGGSRIGDDFLAGGGSSTTTSETRLPASQIGSSAKASIVQAIARQLKPHWTAPDGADAEQLVSILAFELNEDGSLKGRPRVIDQSGITDSNRPQAPLHAERAIRAVQLAAPFDLPAEYYNAWKSIRGARFDRNLSR